MSAGGPPSLALTGIEKSFGSVRALLGANLTVRPGEIHALLGENGAGKSTLVSIAAGRLRADAGSVQRDGRLTAIRDPREAKRAGIALVPQHDLLVEAATVADNLAFLDPEARFLESKRARRERVRRLAEHLELDVGEPDALVGELPVGTRQRIEIAAALVPDPAVLILDEPTAILSPEETAALFGALRKRARAGRTVLLITHRLAEVFEVADHLTLLARGRTVKECAISDTRPDEIAGLLLGAAEITGVASQPPAVVTTASAPLALVLKDFRPAGSPSPPASLEVPAGSHLTLLAIDGNGADVFAAAVAGLREADGRVRVAGSEVPTGRPRAFRSAGGAYVPPDRRAEGLVLDLSLWENLALGASGNKRRGPFVDQMALEREARDVISRFGVRAASPRSKARELSGGNQQKLILARELEGGPRLLVAVHPTRGLDLAATADIRRRLQAARADGCGVVVVTSDPEEAFELAAPIRVVYRSRLSESLPHDTPPHELGLKMAGLAA